MIQCIRFIGRVHWNLHWNVEPFTRRANLTCERTVEALKWQVNSFTAFQEEAFAPDVRLC
jgi:hypothetical protein